MIGTSEAPAASTRNLVAGELAQTIADSRHDSQTLQEILLVINHECLCREVESSTDSSSRDVFQGWIGTSAVGKLAHQLSSCRVQYIDASSHIERELQCRALLSVVALLHLRGVAAHEADSQTRWQRQINNLFRDLVWLPTESTVLSSETFHRLQASHLLSLAAAHAQQIPRAEPTSAVVLPMVGDVVQLGVIAANIASV
jgi:hypothetical protein